MRVSLVKGRIDAEAEATFAHDLKRGPPFYFFSWIIHDLEPACRARGWDVDVLSIGKAARRPQKPDLLVNLITEPLICRRSLDRLEAAVKAFGFPIVNKVEAVRRSARTALPAVIGASDVPRVRVPLTTRFAGPAAELENHIRAAGHRFPVLLRPAGTHSSKGLTKVENPAALRELKSIPADLLISDFVDFRSSDGFYRKYRMIWVDGTTFRRHLITSVDWNVTGQARVHMAKQPETISSEKAFLAAEGGALDQRVARLFLTVGLDFGVIDFAVTDEDEITVFELNGTFQISGSVPPAHFERWGYLERNNGAILDALVAAIGRRGHCAGN
jgi:hypothetical protein